MTEKNNIENNLQNWMQAPAEVNETFAWNEMQQLLHTPKKRRSTLWWWWLCAVGLLMLLAYYFYTQTNQSLAGKANGNTSTAAASMDTNTLLKPENHRFSAPNTNQTHAQQVPTDSNSISLKHIEKTGVDKEADAATSNPAPDLSAKATTPTTNKVSGKLNKLILGNNNRMSSIKIPKQTPAIAITTKRNTEIVHKAIQQQTTTTNKPTGKSIFQPIGKTTQPLILGNNLAEPKPSNGENNTVANPILNQLTDTAMDKHVVSVMIPQHDTALPKKQPSTDTAIQQAAVQANSSGKKYPLPVRFAAGIDWNLQLPTTKTDYYFTNKNLTAQPLNYLIPSPFVQMTLGNKHHVALGVTPFAQYNMPPVHYRNRTGSWITVAPQISDIIKTNASWGLKDSFQVAIQDSFGNYRLDTSIQVQQKQVIGKAFGFGVMLDYQYRINQHWLIGGGLMYNGVTGFINHNFISRPSDSNKLVYSDTGFSKPVESDNLIRSYFISARMSAWYSYRKWQLGMMLTIPFSGINKEGEIKKVLGWNMVIRRTLWSSKQ